MLVAITIFLILATIAISAFRDSDPDRAAAASQQLRSMLEGARSRAIHDGQPRGLRLLLDSNNPRTVTSLVYIGAPRLYEATANNITYSGTYPTGFWRVAVSGNVIQNLIQRRLLNREDVNNNGVLDAGEDLNMNGVLDDDACRVEIPAFSGTWYSIAEVGPGYVDLIGHYVSSEWSPMTSTYVARPSGQVNFRIELAAPILAGSTPQPLANQMAIDLDGSKLPDRWRTSPMMTGTFTSPLDILFTPRGDVTGLAATAGVMHFLLADVGDVSLGGPRAQQTPIPVALLEKDERLVSLFTRTGFATTSRVNRNFLAPYTGYYDYALYGVEAK